jgi:hypothetical protein
MGLLNFDLDKFVRLMEEVLVELRAIRALLEDQKKGHTVMVDSKTWKLWEGDTGD